MKKQTQQIALFLALVMLPLMVFARPVAVVDSGTDFGHELLKGHAWSNPKEIPGNRIDDDRNGKVDDVVGWNFLDNYHRVFFQEHAASFNPIIYKLMEIVARRQAGTQTASDLQYWKDHVESLSQNEKLDLIMHLNAFGQYAHGTHVAGIIAALDPGSKMLSARIFADEPPDEYRHPRPAFLRPRWSISDLFYKLLALLSNGVFVQISSYLKESDASVANYSLGISFQMLARQLLALKGVTNPTLEQLSEEAMRAQRKYEPEGRKWITSSSETLFVIAAGNDGSDNDLLPVFPASVRTPNTISVAATHGVSKIASFSNYGKTTVDVAAPGVAIVSAVPSVDRRAVLPMSGTSMAAPYVAGVAAKIRRLNPALTPEQVKMILMETADTKSWLAGKVISGGVVNAERAFSAALTAKATDLGAAIRDSKSRIKDQEDAVAVEPGFVPAKSTSDLDSAAQLLVF